MGIAGSWNDLSNVGDASGDYQPKGYIVEYGGMPGDPVLQIATTTTLTMPAILGVNNNSRCGPGNLSLSVTSVSGTVAWFAQATGGNPIFTSNTYQTPILSTTTVFYVQDAASLSCNNVVRTPVTATIHPIPSITNSQSTTICEGSTAILTPDFDFGTLRWYEDLNDTMPVFEGDSFETPPLFNDTIFYVEAIQNNCPSERVSIQVLVNPVPEVADEILFICRNENLTLSSGISGNTYLWSNNETTENIVVNEPGIYTVIITNSFSCVATKNIEVIAIEVPIIQRIETTSNQAIIFLENEGAFEFSINGIDYFESPVFNLNIGGLYTVYVKGQENDCGVSTQDFIFITIPQFFTPNNDGTNDFWLVRGIENYPQFKISIFDRYGKLLHMQSKSNLGWNGTLNGEALPATDYWFVIEIPKTNQIIKGNFSLIR